ncbi:hypothetical protein N7539_004937 [Penicillium diatomitis]|uniref:PLD phosphodiesterase domain-containing protein n=1 Tax=Penicillium diatomitis TaxID=2819901 RepID=A0A9X0BUA0_9EURO|nr:uncharacterized protein N7539_004937 [Penicillium diatomitis]KAJ5484949.1 hypothetical protein N7539_004937 [Penicillium diatomitis]
MDASALEQQMLAAAIAASLEDYQKQESSSTSRKVSSEKTKESPHSLSKGSDKFKSEQPKENQASKISPQRTSKASRPSTPVEDKVVDLTYDSDSDSEVKEIFPKSRSTVGSNTDEDIPQEVSDNESDDELKQAIAMSLESSRQDSKNSTAEILSSGLHADDGLKKSTLETEVAQKPGGLGIDRKQMEQERLARLAKRKAGSSPPSFQPSSKTARVDPGDGPTHALAAELASSRTGGLANISSVKKPVGSLQPKPRPAIQFPYGVVKKTYVAFVPRSNDDITMEEVFQREDLKVAVLSSFLWDMDWLFTKFNSRTTKFILMMGAKEEATRKQYREETASMHNLDLCFPPMEAQVNNMHSKLMLFYHPTHLRIAVPTANLTRTDWGENGLMENTVFLIDLPRITAGYQGRNLDTAFKEELVYFLRASTLREDAVKALNEFDFTETARYAFVHTIGGSRVGEAWTRSGYCGLGRAITQLGLQPPGPINISYVTSSIGSLNDDFLRAIYLAAKGDDGMTDYNLRYTRESSTQTHDPQRKEMLRMGNEWKDRFHVYFPSDQTVRLAHADPDRTAGTICFSSRWWLGAKFPRGVLKDCVSERRVLMHNKLMYVWPSEPFKMSDGRECKGWAYVGSANISESAWGKLVKDRSSGHPKLNCRNWECGVIVPVTAASTESASSVIDTKGAVSDTISKSQFEAQSLPVKVFHDTVPVPLKIPGADLTESRPPWFFHD